MRKAKYQKSLTVPLSEGIYNRIKEISDINEISMADYVRSTINNQFIADEYVKETLGKED